MFDWNDLRFFLAVARHGRLIDAGRKLGVDHTTVARRIGALEQAIGCRLFHRSPRGLTLTEAGHRLVAHADRMESEATTIVEEMAGQDVQVTGTVRLATPEAFGAYLVAPNIPLFNQLYPQLNLELVAENRAISLSKREADIAIMLGRPPSGRLFARKLTNYALGLYGSADYLAGRPPISNADDLRGHGFISYIEDLVAIPQLKSLTDVVPGAQVLFRSNSIVAQQNAVAAGLGLGLLHHFSAGHDPRLVPLLTADIRIERAYWVVVHADLRTLPRIRAVVDFLQAIVDRQRAQLDGPSGMVEAA
ncbi:LysR family transcriptional regulator [Parapedomonas caeni]